MAELRDTLLIDVAQALSELDRVDKAIDKLYRGRAVPPSPVPPIPPAPAGAGSGGKSASETQLDRISNRLKVVQQEMNRLGEGASQAQLDAYATRLARLATQANLIAPGLDQGGRAAARLAGILTGIGGTSERVSGQLDRLTQGPRAANDPESLRRLRESIKEVGNQITTARNQFIAMSGTATQEQISALTARMTALKTQANLLAQGLPAGSRELRQLSLAAAQAERTIAGANGQMSRLGLASQVKLGVGGALSELQAFQGPLSGLANMAKFADSARLASVLYESQLRRQNIAMDEGGRVVNKLADRLKILPSAAQDAIQVLLRNGFSLEQAYTVLERAGASAVARGRTAADGVSVFAGAIQSQNSAVLNGIGIAGNLSDFYVQYGKTIGKTSNRLTEQEKAQAAVNLVVRETTEELANLDTIQASLGGTFSDLSTAGENFRITFGKTFSGPVGDTAKALTGVTNAMNALPRPLADVLAKLVVFGIGLFAIVKVGLLVKANVAAMNVQLFGTGAAGAAGAGGLAGYNAALALLKTNATTALAALGPLKAGLSVLAAGAVGYSVGLQINAIDTGKGTVGDQIQLKFLEFAKRNNIGGKTMRAILGIDQATAEQGAQQFADDLNGVTKKAEEKYAQLAVQGGEKYAGLLRIRDDVLSQNKRLESQRGSSTDPQEQTRLQRQIDLNTKVAASVEAQATAILKAKAAKSGDVVSTVAQDEAYANLQDSLRGLSEQFGDTKLSGFERDLEQARKGFLKFADDIDKAVKKGDVSAAQGKLLNAALSQAQAQVIPDLVARQVAENKQSALQGQRELEEGRISMIKDGRAKREAELDLETKNLKAEYQKRIDAAKQDAEANGLSPDQRAALGAEAVRLEGERDSKIKLARQKANGDLEALEREHHQKVLEAQAGAAEAQVSVLEAGLAALTQARNNDLTRAGNDSERLAVERRYGQQSVALQRQIAEESQRIKEVALAQGYAEDLRLATQGGAQRQALEVAARTKYGASLRALEIGTRTQIAEAVIAQKEREDKAIAAVEQRGLNRVLANIGKITGAELVSIKGRLEARRALAAASGNSTLTAELDKAIEGVSDQVLQNTEKFRDALRDSGKEAADLRIQLNGIAQTPLQSAQKSAASPYDAVLKGSRKQLDDLRKAYDGVGTPTPEQVGRFRAEQSNLTAIVTSAEAGRLQAKTAATAKYYRDLNDKAEENTLRQSKRDLDLERITLNQYERILTADKAYWEKRRDNAVKGSEDYLAADAKVGEAQSELARLAGERRDLEKDTSAFSREQLQTAVELATNDRDRAVALARLGVLDQRRLTDLDSEISKLEAQGGHEKEILALKRERAGVQKDLVTRQRDEAEAALKLTRSVLDRIEAENKLAEKQARTDAALAATRQRDLGNLRDQVGSVDGQIDASKSEEERNKLYADRAGLLGQILDLERAIALAPVESGREQQELLAARIALRGKLLGLADDEVAVAQEGVRQAAEDLRLVKEKAAVLERKGSPSDQRQSGIEVAQAEIKLLDARNALSKAPLEAEKRRLDLLGSQKTAVLAMAGLVNDELAQSQLKLDLSGRELVLANQRLAAAWSQVEVEAALKGQAEARVNFSQAELGVQQALMSQGNASEARAEAIRSAQREYARAQLKAGKELLEVSLRQAEIEILIRDTAGDALLSAERELGASRARLEQTKSALDTANLSPDDRAGVLREQIDLLGQVAEGERKVAKTRLDAENRLVDVMQARRKATLQIIGAADDGVATSQLDLDIARERLALVSKQVDAPGLGRSDQNDLLKQQIDLYVQVADGERKLGEAQRARQTLSEELVLTEGGLQRELAGGSAETRAAAEAADALATARVRLTQAEREYADAKGSGNLGRIKTATEALTSAIAGQRSAVGKLSDSYRTLLGSMGQIQSASEQLRKVVYGEEGAAFDGNREVSRFFAIQKRRDAAIGDLQKALSTSDRAAIAAATQELAAQEKRYRDQAELLDRNGIEVSLRNESLVGRLSNRVDDLSIQFDREVVLTQQKLDAAQTEAEAALTFSSAVQVFGGTTAELLGGLQAASERLIQPVEAKDSPLSADLASASQQLRAAIADGLAEAGQALAKALRNAAPPPQPPARSSQQQRQLEADLAAQSANQPLPAAQQPTPATPRGGADTINNVKNTTNNWGGINVSVAAQPGQDAGAIADSVVAELQRRADLIGGNC